ncbi:hypothetical protein [Pedobacter arcticus]|uniref:hypothetical protein n=1 Tax=Pedobacter arcticus TaxID=752140 RepID=UPI00037F7ECC|nr:hypothetical protein [Pedobacter arcticus]
MLNRNVISFFKKLILFAVIIFAVDWVLGLALEKLYFSLKKGQFAQNTYALDEASPDILVFGSSRAQHHYSSKILSENLGYSIYNAGRDGQFLPYYCAVQAVILERKTPKIIILDVNIWELGPNEQKYMKLAQLLPYVAEHPVLRNYTAKISKFENLKLISKTYPYNSTLLISVYDHLLTNTEPEDDRGYFPLVGEVSEKMFNKYQTEKKTYDEKRATQDIEIDQQAVAYYHQFLKKTKDLNIKTYVVISPTVLKEPNTEEKSLLESIAKKYSNVKFLDFATDSTYNNHYQLFADEFHLNDKGAEKFSKELAELIK